MEKALNERLSNVENKIKAIDERNRKVELDKSWETSSNLGFYSFNFISIDI